MKIEFLTAGIYCSRLSLSVMKSDTWTLSSVSALSGQLTFHHDRYPNDVHEHVLDQYLTGTNVYGVGSDGQIELRARVIPYQELLDRAVLTADALKWNIGAKPFLTCVDGYPYLSDGPHGVRLDWFPSGGRLSFRIPVKLDRKVLQLFMDPVWLASDGKVLTPLADVIQRLKDNVDIFADPFAERNMSRSGQSIAKQIQPHLQKQARHKTMKEKP